MEQALQLTFRGLPHSDALTDYVTKRAAKLDTFHSHIQSCRIAIDSARKRDSRDSGAYEVRIDVEVPGSEVVVTRGGCAPDAYAAVDAAFDDMKRRLRDLKNAQATHRYRTTQG